jgi:hypothetical protein
LSPDLAHTFTTMVAGQAPMRPLSPPVAVTNDRAPPAPPREPGEARTADGEPRRRQDAARKTPRVSLRHSSGPLRGASPCPSPAQLLTLCAAAQLHLLVTSATARLWPVWACPPSSMPPSTTKGAATTAGGGGSG